MIVFGGYGVENRKELYALFEKESTWHNPYSPKVAIKSDAPKNIQSHLVVSTAKRINSLPNKVRHIFADARVITTATQSLNTAASLFSSQLHKAYETSLCSL